jgi:hypothetical protein
MPNYEWDIETVDADGDVIDHNHRDRVHEFDGEELTMAVAEDGRRLCLVRNDASGRSWAYVKDGDLADTFLDAYEKPVAKVPARYRAEFNL